MTFLEPDRYFSRLSHVDIERDILAPVSYTHLFKGATAPDDVVDPIADATSPHPDVSAAFERVEQRKAAEAEKKKARRLRRK